MTTTMKFYVCMMFASAAACQSSTSLPDDSTPFVQSPTTTRGGLYYYDGARRRHLSLTQDMIAEFQPNPQTRDLLLQMIPGAKAIFGAESESGRLWQIGQHPDIGLAMQSVRQSIPWARFSAVMRGGAAKMRALPGGIIVTLGTGLSLEDAQTWLQDRNWQVDRVLSKRRNVFLIQSPAGLETLHMANQLHESGDVVGATPNWWQPVHAM